MDGLVGTLKRGSGEVSDRLSIYLKSGEVSGEVSNKLTDRCLSRVRRQNTDHSVLTSCHKNKKCVGMKITSRFAGIGDDYRPRQPDRGRHPVQEVSVCPWGTFLNESQPSAKKESIPRRRAGRLGSRTKQPQMQHFKISIGTNEIGPAGGIS